MTDKVSLYMSEKPEVIWNFFTLVLRISIFYARPFHYDSDLESASISTTSPISLSSRRTAFSCYEEMAWKSLRSFVMRFSSSRVFLVSSIFKVTGGGVAAGPPLDPGRVFFSSGLCSSYTECVLASSCLKLSADSAALAAFDLYISIYTYYARIFFANSTIFLSFAESAYPPPILSIVSLYAWAFFSA